MMEIPKCPYYMTQQDIYGEDVLCFCDHPNNPDNTEGNCREHICPAKEIFPEEVQERIDILANLYRVDDSLEKFHILHLYPGKYAWPNGFNDSKFFKIVGYNLETMTKRYLSQERDELFFTMDESYSISTIRAYVDGSILVKFRRPIRVDPYQSATIHNWESCNAS